MADDEGEDWFERALREGEEETEPRAEEAGERREGETPGESADTGAGSESGDGGGEFGAESAEGGEEPGDVFEEDFASAFENAPTGSGFAPESESEPVPSGDFGFGGAEGEDFGFGSSGGTESFEDEEFESDIPRLELGIEGLDEMIQGGVPERSLIVCIGSAGTGKTTFGLQFLNEALENDEPAVFITLEESEERILSTAAEKGWDFREYADDELLAIVDLDPVEMANSLTSIRDELPKLIEEFGASRLVLDSVSLLEMMYDDRATRRTEVYDFTKSLKEAGVTTMFTSEARDDNAFASRYGIIEYLTDAVFVMRYIRPEDFRETRLAIEIQKIRDANHSRETKPYEITNEGISVYRQANIF